MYHKKGWEARMETQSQQTPQDTGFVNQKVPLANSLLVILVSLMLMIGLGIFIGKQFFWNQYTQVPVVDKKIQSLLSEIKKAPGKADKYIELGDLYLDKKDWAKAEAAFKEAAKIEPKGTRAQYNLALTYMAQNNYQDAISLLDPLAKQYPNLDYIQFNTGVTYFELGQYDKALAFLQAASRLQPGGADIWFYMGQAYEKSGNKAEATKAYEKALSLVPMYKEASEALKRVKNN